MSTHTVTIERYCGRYPPAGEGPTPKKTSLLGWEVSTFDSETFRCCTREAMQPSRLNSQAHSSDKLRREKELKEELKNFIINEERVTKSVTEDSTFKATSAVD